MEFVQKVHTARGPGCLGGSSKTGREKQTQFERPAKVKEEKANGSGRLKLICIFEKEFCLFVQFSSEKLFIYVNQLFYF